MRFSNLDDWLVWQETLHYKEIDLGLDRIKNVLFKLGLNEPNFSIVTVAGTNGKGSCIATLDSILSAAGYKTGAFTSPHVIRYNERIKICGIPVSNDDLVHAFHCIDQCRGDVSLTYFEFSTLAAMLLFEQACPDIVLLEVGLGGRLDAVNCFDPDISIITMIDLDHTDWLGQDRETIFHEKAGIFRTGIPAVCGDFDVPESILNLVTRESIPYYQINRDFEYSIQENTWSWQHARKTIVDLPFPVLPGMHQLVNASCVLMVLELLSDKFKIRRNILQYGLQNVNLIARYDKRNINGIKVILDVAHNPSAARMLSITLKQDPCHGRTLAVFAIRSDKNISQTIEPFIDIIDEWFIAEFRQRNSAKIELIDSHIQAKKATKTLQFGSVESAFSQALLECNEKDRIVVFGSFNTITESLKIIDTMSSQCEKR